MHKYLRSIGFRAFDNKRFERLYFYKKENPDAIYRIKDSEGETYIEFHAQVTPECGIAFRGRQSSENGFMLEYYFPYLRGESLSTKEQTEVVKESDREGYYGMCDDLNLGVELIFFFLDMPDIQDKSSGIIKAGGVRLGALASEGVVLLPIRQSVKQIQRVNENSLKRTRLLEAARGGDETAMDKLAQNEMDMFAYANKRAQREDLYSIINTFFMPEGIESDKYSVMGIISQIKLHTNEYTKEEFYIIKLSCNKIIFDLCINRKDLLGLPSVGMRLKAKVWMQGHAYNPL